MKAKETLFDIAKKPLIGEIIIFFFIFLTLGAMAGTMDYFGFKEDERKELFQWFFYVAISYIFFSLCIRIILLIKKKSK